MSTTKRKPATFKDWLREELGPEYMKGLAEHGASAGFPGLTYYQDTVALFEEYEEELWAELDQMADSFGYDSVPELIGTFNGAAHANDPTRFKNLVVWAVAEEYARRQAR